MANFESARPFPVLGRTGDYKEASFDKEMAISPDGSSVKISNISNLVNRLAGDRVGDYLLIENRSTATKRFIPLEGGELVVAIPVSQLWGVTSLTILQISIDLLTLVDANQTLFDDFFRGDPKTQFDIRPGEILGVGETLYLNVSGSSGSNWIQFDKNEDSAFEYRVSTGATGNIVVHLGKELFGAAMMAMSSPESRYWATLSLAKPGVEFAIQSVLRGGGEEVDEKPDWFEGLVLRLSELGIKDEEDAEELTELQRISMQILEAEIVGPLVELIRESEMEGR
jgi:hypothetical protein